MWDCGNPCWLDVEDRKDSYRRNFKKKSKLDVYKLQILKSVSYVQKRAEKSSTVLQCQGGTGRGPLWAPNPEAFKSLTQVAQWPHKKSCTCSFKLPVEGFWYLVQCEHYGNSCYTACLGNNDKKKKSGNIQHRRNILWLLIHSSLNPFEYRGAQYI